MKQLALSALFISLFVFGCKKDNNNVSLDGEYQPGTSLNIGEVKMYVQGKTITDAAVIDEFVTRHNYTSFIYKESPADTKASFSDFTINNDEVIWTFPNGKMKTYILEKSSSSLTIGAKDALIPVILPAAAGPIYDPNGGNQCNRLGYNITTVHKAGLTPSSGPAFPLFPLNRNGNKIHLPLLNYIIVHIGQYDMCEQASGNIWNSFNIAVTQKLSTGDTIVVQQNLLPLNRK